ncbi:hypothetical protein CRM22_010459 [Opisthorchis felineus]|uniref:Innexin n=1 Tax=Opisthorchis felineus TaxID=147828 RepID=A0A4S2L438_OPIFE|nr:hypothetical protein CRM22_010459 [Opisthorchis felineus]
MASNLMPSTSCLMNNQNDVETPDSPTNETKLACYCEQHCPAEYHAHNDDALPTPGHSSSGCQWSTEEQILEQQFATEALKQGRTIRYPEMNDRSLLRGTPYFYEYEGTFPSSPMDHSPTVGHNFGRHRGKLSSDPTFILSLVRWARIGSSRLAGDDDQIDRLNYQITGLILLILIALTGMRQYLSHLPLQCWIPQEFSRSWEEYAENYCWVTNTYYANLESRLPPPEERQNVVRYYQWATFALAVQAAGFYLPCIVWRLLQNHSGFQVQRIMHSTIQVNCAPMASVSAAIGGVAKYIDAVIYRRQYKIWQRPATFSGLFEPVYCYKFSPVEQSAERSKTVPFREAQVQPKDYKILKTSEDPHHHGRATLRSHKKSPAPAPPVDSQQKAPKQTSRSTTPASAQSNGRSGAKPGRKQSSLGSASFCDVCCARFSSCFINQKTSAKNEETDAQSMQTLKPLIEPPTAKTSDEHLDSCRASGQWRTGSAYCPTWCWTHQGESGETHSHSPERKKSGQYQTSEVWFTLKRKALLPRLCNMLGKGFAVVCRLLSTFVCLIPGCLYHWMRGSQRIKCIQRSNAFLFYLYTTIKLLYLLNILGQLCFLKYFLGTDSYIFGLHVLYDLLNGKPWTQTGNFPRVTYCDFEAKKTGKNYKYTLQCVLPLNLFLEKVLLKWLSRLSIPHRRRNFIHKFLIPWKFPYGCEQLNKRSLNLFVDKYLDCNGVFVIWLVSMNASELVAGELISALWDLFWTRICVASSFLPAQVFSKTEFGDNANRAFDESSSSSHTIHQLTPCEQPLLVPTEGKWHSTGHLPNAVPTGSLAADVATKIEAKADMSSYIPHSPAAFTRTTSSSLIIPAVLINQSTNDSSVKASAMGSSLDSIV